ncbi:ABC transporter substrate-binding protein [Anaerobium acetethylicum]|uniref:Putative aldouronate transport system substrate-binding protein n=1 Tax=Anaerobium acetethylicum TaxID=1619234 RepID=A0A1D3TYJ6_9FIRM|nr:ABC transporter substrate-binding protein [Anaerobium acetethylicum]SCP99518.1 putative aldouronate transport system substrate-binding protein [Anaerobium acetethylicum]
MKKRSLALLLTVAMAVSALAGCGSNEGSTEGSSTEGSTTESSSKENGSADHIIVTYLTMGETPTDLGLVQDAVNAISIPEINVEVEFKPVAIGETFTSYSTWIASGERMDLMMLCFQDPSSYIESGSIQPLNEYLSADAPDILNLAKEFPLYEGAQREESIYGVNPVNACYGKYGSIMLRKDYFDELGAELKDKYTYADLTEVFAGIKSNHPDTYPLGVLGSDCSTSNSLFSRFNVVDVLGAGVDTGVLMGMDSTKIVNLFETDEYFAFLKQMKEWNEAGYIMQDATTTTSTMPELTSAGIMASALVYPNEPNVEVAYNSGFRAFGGAVALDTTDPYMPSNGASNGIYWTIPVTSKSPDAAMKFLNLTYSNTEVTNLIQWGIEGKHYVKTDTENVVEFPEGLDANSTGYYCTLGVWGDKSAVYAMTKDNRAENEALTEKGLENRSVASQHGYSYDSSKMANQVIAVDSVLQQYMPALETGSVSDLDSTYKEFISALKAAGMDDIIADNQAQLDAAIAKK